MSAKDGSSRDGSTIHVRNATEQDMAEVLDIYNDVILNTTAVYSFKPHTLESRVDWYRERLRNNFPVIVAVETDTSDSTEPPPRIVGFGSYGPFRPFPGFKYTVEHSIHVHRDSRGRGVGRLLLESLIAEARQRGMHVLVGGIDSSNTASIELHRKLGFQQTALMPQTAFKFGRWLDLALMQLVLPDTPEHKEED